MPAAGRLGDKSSAKLDAHGCPGCPHSVQGPAIMGSMDVFINNRPALRVGDKGLHAPCCGPNMWNAVKGSGTVMINGKPAHRKGDLDQHCGGVGQLDDGSPNVNIGG